MKKEIRTVIFITLICTVLISLFLKSCKILTGYPHRTLMTMEPIAETIGIDSKKGIVYVIFRCEKPPSKTECGIMVQFSKERYGETYLGELRPISKINKNQ